MRSTTDIAVQSAMPVSFAGQTLLLDPSGALFWPQKNLLLVSDLHLEKASFLAGFGSAIPHYDSRDTLQRLRTVITHYAPERVVCLGDSFHDRKAISRLSEEDAQELAALVQSCAEWHWILGNHDPVLDAGLPGISSAQMTLEDILLSHEPEPSQHRQIIGHYHPKVSMKLGGSRVSGRCFLISDALLVMPAFGSFTGGLECSDSAIASLSPTPFERYLLYKGKVWRV